MAPDREVQMPRSELQEPLRLLPEFRRRVWGGRRLRACVEPIGEAWLAYPESVIAAGPLGGHSLAAAAEMFGAALLGERVTAHHGNRFPLLVKLLDTAAWLSIQVHPDDAQARRLEGPGASGKTEAWHVLAAEPGDRVIAGLKAGVTAATLYAAAGSAALLDLVRYVPATAGDTMLIAPGTIHAPGPGLLLYEVQQMSDLTYRIYDWERPQAAGRSLHLAQALAVVNVGATAPLVRLAAQDGDQTLAESAYFRLERIAPASGPLVRSPAGASFEALTVTSGAAELRGPGWQLALAERETVIVPAACPRYEIIPRGGGVALIASVP